MTDKKNRAERWTDVLDALDEVGKQLRDLQSIIDEYKEAEPEIEGNVLNTPAPPIAFDRSLFLGSTEPSKLSTNGTEDAHFL